MNLHIPRISLRTIRSYKTNKELIDNIPSTVICDNITSFDELKKRYNDARLMYSANENNYEIKS